MSQVKPLHYGLKNCHYALKQADGTYAAPKRLVGAVGITVEPEGDTSTFYADNTAYFVTTTNTGRSGSLELAGMNNEALCDLLPYEMDDNGLVVEVADRQSKECALMFEVETDTDKPTKFLYYCVKFTRSSQDHGTMEESADPDTESFDYTAIPCDFDLAGQTRKVVGAHIDYAEQSAEKYEAWYEQVTVPEKGAEATPSVTISPKRVTLAVGGERQLEVTTVPEGASVVWASDDEDDATVSEAGLVAGVAAGSANVTATITVNGAEYSDSCSVRVNAS